MAKVLGELPSSIFASQGLLTASVGSVRKRSTMSDSSPSKTARTAVSAVVIVLDIIFVALRFHVRIFTKVGLKWDDWLILLPLILTALTEVLLLWGEVVDPGGATMSQNTDPNYVYTQISGATKLSILFMYERFFSHDSAFRCSLAMVGFLVTGWWIGCTVAMLTNCIPLSYVWTSNSPDPAYCFNYNVFWMASGVCEVLIDITVLALPVRVVFGLQLSPRKKATVACIFLLGGFVIITGVVKVILGYVPGGCVPSYAQTEIWATVHVCIAIVCACLPLLMPLIRRVNDSMVMWKLRGRAVAVERRNHSSERSVLSEGTSRHRRSNYEHFNGGLELMGGTSAPAAASE